RPSDLLHRGDRGAHDPPAPLGRVPRLHRELTGLARAVGVLLDGSGQLLHARRRLLKRGRLFLGGGGDLLRPRRELLGGEGRAPPPSWRGSPPARSASP